MLLKADTTVCVVYTGWLQCPQRMPHNALCTFFVASFLQKHRQWWLKLAHTWQQNPIFKTIGTFWDSHYIQPFLNIKLYKYTNHIRNKIKRVKTHYFPIILLLFIIWSYLGLLHLVMQCFIMMFIRLFSTRSGAACGWSLEISHDGSMCTTEIHKCYKSGLGLCFDWLDSGEQWRK